MKDSGYFWTKLLHFFTGAFSDKASIAFRAHSDKTECLKPSRATLKGLVELKHRQIYKTQRLPH